MNKTKINKIDIDWRDIKNKCRTTVGKEYTEIEPSDDFKQRLLISEHSPIRLGIIDWTWCLKSWVATHFARHKYNHFISTQRTDRTGINRDKSTQDTKVIYDGNANIQNLIDLSKKRLCYQCSKETREYMEDLKASLLYKEPQLYNVLVPNCIYRLGCPEFKECGHFKRFLKFTNNEDMTNINIRYKTYSEFIKFLNGGRKN